MDRWLKIVDDFFDSPESSVPQPSAAPIEPIAAAASAATEEPILEANKKIAQSAAAESRRGRSQKETQPEKRIAVHCVAGLGRAPFLVALAIVYKGCPPQNAIKLIRNNRKGALNPI